MKKWLILVEVSCTDANRVQELQAWYDKTHTPSLLHVPGIVWVTRYENVTPEEAQSRFPTLLEVEAEDI